MKTLEQNALIKLPAALDFARRIQAVAFQVAQELQDIGKEYVQYVDAKPEFRSELIELGVSRDLLRRLELLGRNQIDSRLLLDTSTQAKLLLHCPTSVQAGVIENGVEVLDPDETNSRIIPFDQLTPQQARLAINGKDIRPLAAQRTLLREWKVSRATVVHDTAIRILKDRVTINEPGTFTRAQLLQWLSQMG